MDLSYFVDLPKIELHAHINAAVSQNTAKKLFTRSESKNEKLAFEEHDRVSLNDSFDVFNIIHRLSNTTETAYMVASDVIKEFAEDGVKYVELRSTPRDVGETGMSKESYIESVIRAITDNRNYFPDIIVKFLLSIDRRNSVDAAKITADLVEKYMNLVPDIVVGLDFSGNPMIGDGRDFVNILKNAKNRGIKLAVHLAEAVNQDETMELLKIVPDRIGHGTCLHSAAGGSEEMVNFVSKHRIPLELCLTSNLKCKTVSHFSDHHFKFWHARGHPVILCTDGKGVFDTSLSKEYAIAANTFSLTKKQMWDMSFDSINYIFADDTVKDSLRNIWQCKESSQTF